MWCGRGGEGGGGGTFITFSYFDVVPVHTKNNTKADIKILFRLLNYESESRCISNNPDLYQVLEIFREKLCVDSER